ncbi:flagellar biosynthesis protein FlhF [Paenibacillus segetis]|uniref:Flagellar biosynthesis protein FlhF n=1 Tax=Paenibacillus segetis TaxID=1325360 RepID=A0ABQ1YAM7_9BACL|nr:flagellar biosynthesis protein FlhF [Paenibacillus segetis]GGH17709.1 flagellar biosynthesis regulator FlhF [Paenibacillus segetis]
MRVKRYIVDTMPDAMHKIRGELGADAVILSTKELKIGGFLGMFQKKKIEVIAASETTESSAPKGGISRPVVSSPPPVARQSVPEAYRKSSQMMSSSSSAVGLKERPEAASRETTSVSERDDLVSRASPPVRDRQPQMLDERLSLFLESESKEQPVSPVSAPLPQPEVKEDRLFEEIKQMKSMMSKIAKQQEGIRELPEALLVLQSQLQAQEISSELVDEWIEDAYNEWIASSQTLSNEDMVEQVRSTIGSFLNDHIGEGIREETQIVYIAGPTGVGKTTTIAKLAADQIFRVRKKVGFITADTYRISAIEQLRTYASILNVPLEVVQSPGDMQRATQRLAGCDLIIMDTAGRNYLNELFVAELHSLFSPSAQSETYLVLSLTSKIQDMKRITEHFSRYGLEKVIFTKLDETESIGPLYNLLNEYPLKASYITNGQNVPDDLLTVDQKMLIDLLLLEERSS